MCGLLGIYHRHPREPVDLAPMLRLIEHRGPDDVGRYSDPKRRLQLGFRRLAIIDLETGEQPVSNEDGTIVVVLIGEIYNYVELTVELKARGHRFRSHGDSEVLVHLYEDMGDALLERLEGMFAFALWDSRRGRLVLARDHAGIKPLYYTANSDRVAFSSEIKPLLRLPSVSRELDPAAIKQYLTFGYVLAPQTIFRDIRKLPSGHKLVLEDGTNAESEFWHLRHPRTISAPVDDVKQRVLVGFDEAIRLHLRSDVAVGAFLSGGLDSSLMVARASHLHPRLRTYTLRFEGGRQDESALAQLVASKYGTEHRTFTVQTESMQALISQIVWACDEPLGDSGLLPNYVISMLARQDGVKVVLNGAGGDELFAGYTYFFRSEVERKLHRFHAPVSLTAALLRPFTAELSRKLHRASLFETDPIRHYVGHVTVWPPEARNGILANSMDGDPTAVREQYATEFAGDCLNRKLYAEIKTYLVDDLMLLLDRMTMAHSLEGRVPFLHRPFMELVMGIHGDVKAPRGERKSLLRSISAEFLPPALLDQPKMGFNSPIREWMAGSFGDLVLSFLGSEKSLGRPWWNRRAFRRFLEDRRARRAWQHRLFVVFMLEVFCRVHVDGAWDDPRHVPPIEALI